MRRGKRIATVLLAALAMLAVSLAVYAPSALVDAGLASRTSVRLLYGVAALLLFTGFAARSRAGAALALATALSLPALLLAGNWGTGASPGAYICGLVPFSDARAYLHCGRLVAEGATFEHLPICSRRPLFITLLAGLLMATGQNLRLVNLILVMVTAVACFVASLQVQWRYGPWASTVFFLVLSLFYRPFVGTLLTEHLGLALGALGFALLLRGADLRRPSLFLLGCLATAFALSARAGAFFVLPLLALWGGRYFRRESFLSARVLAGAVVAMAIGVGSSVGLSAALGRADGAFSNFSYVLYGLVSGSDWRKALQDHPELVSFERVEHPARIYALAVELLRSDPWSLGRGAWRAWRAFLGLYPFSFVGVGPPVAVVLAAMAMVGIVRASRRRLAGDSLVLAMALGVLLSVPFVPPWDADSMRAYAATLPLIAVLPALGIATMRVTADGDEARGAGARVAVAGVTVIVGACFLPPFLGRALGDPMRYPSRAPTCEATVFARVTPGSFVDVVADRASEGTRFALSLAEFRAGLEKLGRPPLAQELARLEPPFRLVSAPGIGPDGRSEFLLLTAPHAAPADGRLRNSCAALSSTPDVRRYNLAYPQDEAGAFEGAKQ